jgi:uncharacterized protein YjbJ (UPF0337 family)
MSWPLHHAHRRRFGAGVLAAGLGLSTMFATACKSGKQNVQDGQSTEGKGKIEKVVGDVTGNDNKKAEGQNDEQKGKTQKAIGKAQENVNSAVDKVTNP